MADNKVKTVMTEDKPFFSDGLTNLATGLGGSKDKSTYNVWNHTQRNYDHVSLSARFRECWISNKIVKIIPADMTRNWREFANDDATEADEEFEVGRLFREAQQWARLYGTSFMVLDIDDGRTADKPINWKGLKPGCIRNLHVVDRTRMVATGELDLDPMSPMFQMPLRYQFVNSTTASHRTGFIRC